MSAPKLELAGIRKDYSDGAVVAVDGIDLVVERGETVALLGPSGCGKSTALSMIVGLERPSAGDIRIDGRSVVDVPAGRRDVGLVFQDYAVFTHMSVADNLAFGLSVRGLPKAEIARRVGETAELLGLTDTLREKASRLGGSQLQRVAIGRTLVTRPAILLLDEPLSNLEAEARLAMRRELRRLQSEIDLTIVYVTHDQVEALSLASRIAVMSAGKIRQYAPTAQVYDAPEHVFVARFIGSPGMNLVEGALVRDADGARFARGRIDVALSPLALARAPAEEAIVLGIRPESLAIADPDEPSIAGAVEGRILSVSPRGPEAVVTLGIDDVRLVALVEARRRPQEGARVSVSFASDAIVVFCGESGRNLAHPASGRLS